MYIGTEIDDSAKPQASFSEIDDGEEWNVSEYFR